MFSDDERAVLRALQADLPDSATPYADIAHAVGVDEAFVLALATKLKNNGAIRRFGASIKHQQAGWAHNAMVAWLATEAEAEKAGPIAAANPQVSHCYLRPSSAPDWPYTFYTMIHGQSRAHCLEAVEALRRTTGLEQYAILESLRELKKTSMVYF